MDALQAILTRRSTRRFSDQMPETALIEKVIEAGRYAPSGGNSQTTHMSFTGWMRMKMCISIWRSMVWRRMKRLQAG